MITTYYILLTLVIISELSILSGLLLCRDSRIKKRYMNYTENPDDGYQFYLMIPMFDESSVAEKVYDFFYQIAAPNAKCVFITTEKETKIQGSCKTREVLESLMREKHCENVFICHYPKTTGNKVEQLNYFLHAHRAELDKPNVFVIDYDCDSRPDRDVIRDLRSILNSTPNANIMQQSSRFWSVNRDSALLNVEAIFQTRWAFGYERFAQYISTFEPLNRLLVPFYYCVGHGLCIRASFLYHIGLFPSPLEDVPMGMMMTLLQEPIYPCVTKDIGEVVPSVKALLRQAGHWVRSPLQTFHVLKKAKQLTHISIYRQTVYLLRMALDIISWIQYLLLLLLSLSLLWRSVWYVLAYVIFLYLISFLSGLLTNKLYSGEKTCMDLRTFILLPVRHIIRGFSVFSCLYQHCFGWFYDKRKNK